MNREFKREGPLWVPKKDVLPVHRYPVRRLPHRNHFQAALAYISSGKNSSGSGTSLTLSPTPSAGNLIVVSMLGSVAASLLSISDDKANKWWPCISQTNNVAGDRVWCTWFCSSAASGATTITLLSNVTQGFIEGFYDIFSGHNSIQPFDQASTNFNTTGTALSSGSKTTRSANEIIYGFVFADGTPITKGASFTAGNAVLSDGTEYKIVSSTASYDADATQSSNANWGMVMATFADSLMLPATDNKRRSSLAWPLPIGVPPCPDGTVS